MYRLNEYSNNHEDLDKKFPDIEIDLFDLAEEAIIFHGLEKCITGVDQFGYAVYDYCRMIDSFTEDGMTPDEAMEWIDYNVACVNAGKGFVIHYRRPSINT